MARTNSAGAVTSTLSYDEYGNPAATNTGRFMYTGQIWLRDAGVYHYKNRAYHPGLMRFLQTDPIGVAGGINLYAYVGGDPINFTDPMGLSAEDADTARDRVCTGSRIKRTNCSGFHYGTMAQLAARGIGGGLGGASPRLGESGIFWQPYVRPVRGTVYVDGQFTGWQNFWFSSHLQGKATIAEIGGLPQILWNQIRGRTAELAVVRALEAEGFTVVQNVTFRLEGTSAILDIVAFKTLADGTSLYAFYEVKSGMSWLNRRQSRVFYSLPLATPYGLKATAAGLTTGVPMHQQGFADVFVQVHRNQWW